MLNCKICQSSAVRDYKFPFPLVKPLNYEIIRDPSATVFCCLDCGAIFRPVKDANYYQEEEDIDNEDSVVTVYAPEYGGYVSNHFYMGQLLTGLINLSNPSVLDIGCGNGKFLGELSHRFPRYRLSGYDPEVALTKHFKSSKHINYYHGELEDIPHEYDLICFIDSLSYIDDISSLFAFLDSHISPDGQIFITSPDVSRNNMTLLVDGQSYFFTAANLSSIFSKFGYQLDLIDVSKVFPRHIFGVAKKCYGGPTSSVDNDQILNDALRYMSNLKRNYGRLDKITSGLNMNGCRLGVLGTKHNSAITIAELGDDIKFVADETKTMVGKNFHGIKVVHPSELGQNDIVLLPYGRSSRSIKTRYQSQVKARFVEL